MLNVLKGRVYSQLGTSLRACGTSAVRRNIDTSNIIHLATRQSRKMSRQNLRDFVRVNDLLLHLPLQDGSRWPSPRDPQPQPVLLSVSVLHDTSKAAQDDDIKSTIDYDSLSTLLMSKYNQSSVALPSLEALLDGVAESCFEASHAQELYLLAKKTKAVLHAEAVGIERSRSKDSHFICSDRYFIEGLQCSTTIGINLCEREVKQAVHFHLSMSRSPSDSRPVNFRQLTHQIHQAIEDSSFFTLEALASHVARTVLQSCQQNIDRVTVRGQKPNALLYAKSSEVEISRTLADFQQEINSISVDREETSVLSFQTPDTKLSGLLEQVAPDLFATRPGMYTVAIALGSNLGDRFANIELALRLLETSDIFDPQTIPNLVDDPQISIIDTSFMYETAPMYVTDQPDFINCACLIETNIRPESLLAVLKWIEKAVGRVPSIRNGPRAVDLDILTYGSEIIDTRPTEARGDLSNLDGQLVVPHPRIAEREFVLRPLADMIPDYILPESGKSVGRMLDELEASEHEDASAMYRVIPFPKYPISESRPATPSSPGGFRLPAVPATAKYWKYPCKHRKTTNRGHTKTYIMATLNVTPDSFSDGSKHNTLDAALKYTTSSVQAGMDILDIGGYSTRPGAAYISPQEETDRVVPVIHAMRTLRAEDIDGNAVDIQHLRNALISVDTFRPDVAEAAVRAGANCINDVYAFAGPEYPLNRSSAEHFLEMRKVARSLAVPVILMHSRGDAGTNKDYSNYDDAHDDKVLEGIRVELGERVRAAVRGPRGLRRWLVIVDPGVGFSKPVEGNLAVLREGGKIVSEYRGRRGRNPLAGYPQLIGTSRKSFLGKVLERPDAEGTYRGRSTTPVQRGWATAAAVSSAVQQGATVVRVHDVLELGDVVRVADALWK